MTRRPKLQDVAERAGVSRATVSQVLRGAGRISEATRTKVEAAAEALSYIPDTRAASMRSGRSREVGMVIHGLANPFNAEVISGVANELERRDHLVSILDSDDDPDRQLRNLKAFISSSRGGLIWVPATSTSTAAVDLLRKNRIPTVAFLRKPPAIDFDHLGIDNHAATDAATVYLAGLGHRRIAFFGGQGPSQVRQERIGGYESAMRRMGLGETAVLPCADSKSAGLEAAGALMRARPDVTALVCNGDMVAIGACLACQKLGLVPGRDLSIIGFDDTEDAAIATPPLTTLSVSPRQLGRKLARMLLDRMEEPGLAPVSSLVSARLVVRQTTGPAPDLAHRQNRT